MVRDIFVSHHCLNVLIVITLVVIIIIVKTDIIHPNLLWKTPSLSNWKLSNYDQETHQLIQIAQDNSLNNTNLQQKRVLSRIKNDTFLPLPPSKMEASEFSNTKDDSLNNTNRQQKRVLSRSKNDTFLPLLSSRMEVAYGGFQEVGSMSGVFVYSANFDYRASSPGIQVVVIAPFPNERSQFVCVLGVSSDLSDTVRVKGVFTYIPEPNWKYPYRSGVVFCPLTKELTRPKTISLLSTDEDPVHNILPIHYPEHRKYNLTRCYPVFHSSFKNVSDVVWNIEISRLFGVDKFIFYKFDVHETVSKVLFQYQKEGLVEIRNWNIPVNRSMIHYWGQLASMHDCLYSQVGQSRFLLFADIDELVIPRKVTSLVRLAESLLFRVTFQSKRFGALVIRNVFFPMTFPKGKEIFPERSAAQVFKITPLLYTMHSKVHNAHDRSKLLVIPEAIQYLYIHSVERFRKGWTSRVVDRDVALLHHYRHFPADDMGPPWKTDKFLLRYSALIVNAIRQRFSKLRKVNALSTDSMV